MDIKTLRTLKPLIRDLAGQVKRLKKATHLVEALVGFTGTAHGEIQEVTRQELTAAVTSMRANIDAIGRMMGIENDLISPDRAE